MLFGREYPSSNFIAKGAYRYKFDIDPTTGERIFLPLTAEEIQVFGEYSDGLIRKTLETTTLRVNIAEGFQNEYPGAEVGLPLSGEPDVMLTRSMLGAVRGPTSRRDAPSDGSVMLLFATPPGFGPRVKEICPFGDLNVNLVLRVEPGTFFEFNSYTPSPSTRGKLIKNDLMFRNFTTFTTESLA